MMRRARRVEGRLIAVALLGLIGHVTEGDTARAADLVAPPVMYAPNLWQGKSVAVIRILRRVDSHIEEMTIPVGQEGQYKTLHLHVEQCVEKPPTLPRDAAARLSIRDDTNPDFHFDGWIVQNAPALSTYTNPLYGVSVVRCEGNPVAPLLAPLPAPVKPDPDAVKKPEDAQGPTREAAGPQLSSPNSQTPQEAAPFELAPGGQGLTAPANSAPSSKMPQDAPLQLAPP
ncbi:DUF2155 domain-containing protein [Candidatus Kirkpatrickella diaphorinae]|uniref:DUF2155 domain-containing protein n=1 Tax=Candidatus Kirkpatrickella diaphorinae TaxID=2984322 RepID=A0ABY6GIK0_9PROT|nr:DUF2155 domain-containing protein [Candidatus Kirkpatrickella diaphorinae]UYH51334.1 DUF2155 domain-containing protein [Candidatus Kirkpatrickella diaphorinae]